MPGQTVQSVERALTILNAFTGEDDNLSLTEISKRVGLTPSTTHRLLNTLKEHRFVEKTDSNRYVLGISLLKLSRHVRHGGDVRDLALTGMRGLARESGLGVTLFVTGGTEAICVERIDGPSPIKVMVTDVGDRLPYNCGATPRAILSQMSDEAIRRLDKRGAFYGITTKSIVDLDDIFADVQRSRSQGYTLGMEDVAPNVAAIGVPLLNSKGDCVGAISAVGVVIEFTEPTRRDQIATLVMESAHRISSFIE